MSPDCGIVAVPFSCLPCRFVPLLGPPPISSSHAACLACRCPPRFAVSHRLRPVIISFCRPVISSVISGNSPASCSAFRPASRFSLRRSSRFSSRFSSRLSSRSPLVMSSPSCPIAPPSCRSALRLSLAPPCLSIGWEQDGTGLPLSLSSARLAAAACSGMAWGCVCSDCGVLPACSTGDRFVSVL